MMGSVVYFLISDMTETSLSGPTEQLTPIASAPREDRHTAADGTSQPVKVRPFSSNVMVTNTGSDVASFAARSAAFAS